MIRISPVIYEGSHHIWYLTFVILWFLFVIFCENYFFDLKIICCQNIWKQTTKINQSINFDPTPPKPIEEENIYSSPSSSRLVGCLVTLELLYHHRTKLSFGWNEFVFYPTTSFWMRSENPGWIWCLFNKKK